MSEINWSCLNDAEKLDLLRLLYHDLKNKDKLTAVDIEHKKLIIAETQRVYNRIKKRSN